MLKLATSAMAAHSLNALYCAFLGALVLVMGCAGPSKLHETASPPNTTAAQGAGLIVIASDASAPFGRVMAGIVKQWPGPVEVYRLTGQAQADAALQAQLQSSPRTLVAAVGLPAAQLAHRLTRKKIVFCQVFNYMDANLPRPWMKGVSMVPAVEEQFRAWKKMNPRLDRVGVITGSGLDAVINEARLAAARQGIQLLHFLADSDLTTLRTFERNGEIRAWWVLPDNRVLSRTVLREMLSPQRARQVLLVNGDRAWGGQLTANAEPDDIATLVVQRLIAAANTRGDAIPGPNILSLRQAKISAPRAAAPAAVANKDLSAAFNAKDRHDS